MLTKRRAPAEKAEGETPPDSPRKKRGEWWRGDRGRWFKTRLSEAELALLRHKAEAQGLTASEFIRRRLAEVEVRPRVARGPLELRQDAELYRQLARIGNNLNQVARWANMHADPIEGMEILTGLRHVWREVEEFVRVTRAGRRVDAAAEGPDAAAKEPAGRRGLTE